MRPMITRLTRVAAVLVIAALVAVVVLILAAASDVDAQQQAGTLYRIGVLASSELTPALQEAFRQGLRDHGYIEGRNVLVEWRAAGASPDQAATLAAELIELKVAVIVAVLTPAVQAARKAGAGGSGHRVSDVTLPNITLQRTGGSRCSPSSR